MKLKIEIFKSNDGKFALNQKTETIMPSIRELYQIAHPSVTWDELPQKQKRGRAYRFGKTNVYKELKKEHETKRHYEKHGTAIIEFDGRIRKGIIKYLVVDALNKGVDEIEYYPISNKNKPPELRKVYIKKFNIIQENLTRMEA